MESLNITLAFIHGLPSPFQVKKLWGFIKIPSAYSLSSLMKQVHSFILTSIRSVPNLAEVP